MLVLSYCICDSLFQAYKFQEDFKSALEGFSQASLLDPGWKEPELQEKRLLMYLTCVADLVEAKVWFVFTSPLQLEGSETQVLFSCTGDCKWLKLCQFFWFSYSRTQWLKHLWNHENLLETGVVQANEC